MSEFGNINQEAIDAQQQYETEREESRSGYGGAFNAKMQPEQREVISGITVNMNPQPQQPKARPGWNTKDGRFWTFNNYDNLPAEYKQFIPREATKSNRNPNAKLEPVTHQDPFDGQSYKYGVTFFDNGGSSVWSVLHDPNKPSYSGGKKSFYLDCGIKSFNITEADALLAANESASPTRYKVVIGYPMMNKAQAPDGSAVVRQEERVLLLKQKRIEYGG